MPCASPHRCLTSPPGSPRAPFKVDGGLHENLRPPDATLVDPRGGTAHGRRRPARYGTGDGIVRRVRGGSPEAWSTCALRMTYESLDRETVLLFERAGRSRSAVRARHLELGVAYGRRPITRPWAELRAARLRQACGGALGAGARLGCVPGASSARCWSRWGARPRASTLQRALDIDPANPARSAPWRTGALHGRAQFAEAARGTSGRGGRPIRPAGMRCSSRTARRASAECSPR